MRAPGTYICHELFTTYRVSSHPLHAVPCLPLQEVLGPYANKPDNETWTVVELTAVRAGKSFLSFKYVSNDSNETVFKK